MYLAFIDSEKALIILVETNVLGTLMEEIDYKDRLLLYTYR